MRILTLCSYQVYEIVPTIESFGTPEHSLVFDNKRYDKIRTQSNNARGVVLVYVHGKIFTSGFGESIANYSMYTVCM
jgi:ribonuclease HIII